MFSRKKLLKERDSLQEKVDFYEAFLRDPSKETATALVRVYDAENEYLTLVQNQTPYRSSHDLVALVSQALGQKQKSLVPVSPVLPLEEVVKQEERVVSKWASYAIEAIKVTGEYLWKGIKYMGAGAARMGMFMLPGRLEEQLDEEFNTNYHLKQMSLFSSVIIDGITGSAGAYALLNSMEADQTDLKIATAIVLGGLTGLISGVIRDSRDLETSGPLITYSLYIPYRVLKGIGKGIQKAAKTFHAEVQKRIEQKSP